MSDATNSTLPAPRSPLGGLPRPEPGAPRPYHFPRFERRTLPNGLRLVVAPAHKLPVVTVAAVVRAGASSDPEGREGLASLTARALTEGTASLDAVALTRTVERLGAAVDAGADWDAAFVSLTTLASRLPEAFRLFADVLADPAFPEREVERLKQERIADILQLRTEPRGLADEMFARFVYAPGSRYGRPEAGDERSVSSLGRDDVARFHAERYVPGATTLVVAGDVTVDDAERLAREALGGWTGDAPSMPRVDDRPAARERRVHLVTKADAPQSELRVGHVGVPRVTPDYFGIVVMNAILGGLFNSRVNMNLREEHAYTYGAGSGFDWRLAAGPFDVSSAVQSDVTSAALGEILKEIDRMRAEPVSPSELSLATSYLDGVFPIRYETTAAIASALSNLTIYGLPEDYFDTYRDRIRGVTAADVQAAAVKYLKPDELQLVVVGNPSVRPDLESLGAGPVTVYDAEGKAIG
ncbi:peptidase M16 domain protein [Gemmatirosa kalamazoonensis]|uniref:Peptidase M16 domain protein n=1 Tax=Gemmatirosa kalamazoonensis TaxID=861299 RepID=W0RDD4_9BACT|nr:pitrilysin family protein [Gemmatirosa kalamazoonensis]AHG88452.1 peptidase M16 domain protein [Gemmatirosa kalamazoonensis]